MVFDLIVNLCASLIIVLRRFFLLIFFPYRTLRKISQEKDYFQPLIIIIISFLYFQIANKIRPFNYYPNIIFLVFLMLFLITTAFFYLGEKIFNKKNSFKGYLFTLSYSLYPTMVWFISNSVIYYFLPPPRTMSLLGKGFSIFFITFSLSLLIWKIILVYLAVRFSSKLGFYRVIFLLILYLCLFLPSVIIFYQMKIFRVPFI